MNSSGGSSVLQAISEYRNDPKTKTDGSLTNRELHRFADYFGNGRILREINPAEVGAYSESVGEGGAVPQVAERLKVVRSFLTHARKRGEITVNLAQHVRVRKGRTSVPQGGGVAARAVIELTAQGHKALKDKLALRTEELKSKKEDIEKARADGDVTENAPLDAALEARGLLEAEIRDIEFQLKDAVIISPRKRKNDAVVRVGARIRLKPIGTQGSDKVREYTVVSASEANPLEGKISDVSPVGRAVMRRRAGQQVEVVTPRGTQSFKIVKVTT